MATVPAVYVTIEDQSFALPQIPQGRSVYTVIVGDRGPHNRVVECNSVGQFQRLFGKPDFFRTGQGHYIADKALQFTERVFVVRASLIDSVIETKNAALANAIIKYNNPNGSNELYAMSSSDRNGAVEYYNAYNFANAPDTNTTSAKIVYTDAIGFEKYNPGDFIYSDIEDGDEEDKAVRILTKEIKEVPNTKTADPNDTMTIYVFNLEEPYTGTTTLDANGIIGRDNNHNVTAWVSSYKFYPGVEPVENATFSFLNGSNIVIAADEVSYNSVNNEEWIFPVLGSYLNSRQIIQKYVDDITGEYTFVLDQNYTGETSTAPEAVKTYVPFEIIHETNIRSVKLDTNSKFSNPEDGDEVDLDHDNVWTFTGVGTGTFYNNIFLKGVRNIELERMFTDDDGEPLYKYAFMDLYVYQQNNDGSETLLEGPWAVSLINKTNTGQVIRDLSTGKEMYIETVINDRSDFINCFDSLGSYELLENVDNESLRLQVQALFAEGTVFKLSTRGQEGFFLANGENGALYDPQGRINLWDGEIEGCILRAYNGTLPSVDGTIELIVQHIYPWYIFDYVTSGGYSRNIQNAARQLVDGRGDALLLADTGSFIESADDDIDARLNDVPWNTWNAMLYTQYRKVFDPYTGRYIWISPVYHAIQKHLFVDDKYWIAEPVAGIEKGAIQESILLAYKPSFVKLEDMLERELNPVLVEPDGKYILTQFTTWKRLSVMKRAHAVKFVQFVKKQLPPLLKDILQHKATKYWISQVDARINGFLTPFLDGNASERLTAIKSFSSTSVFDEARSEINVILTLHPIRAIEAINVRIVVK